MGKRAESIHLYDLLSVPESPPAPWGTSPVGSHRLKDGAPPPTFPETPSSSPLFP
jgi:hypothetical protein